MKKPLVTALMSGLCLFLFSIATQAQTRESPYGKDSPIGKPDTLPPGVPRNLDPNGNLFHVEPMFTTPAYQDEALRLIIEEANRVAADLGLPESLPIVKTNLPQGFISPFGYAYIWSKIGNITTSNFSYGVEHGNKFSDLTVAKYDERCLEYCRKYKWPLSKLDTNTPYSLATQWLAAVHMDVAALNRECDVHVSVSPYWNDVQLGQLPKDKFTPLYVVWWATRDRTRKPGTGGTEVELFLPTKELIQLTVSEPKYILRPPLVFTNLSALFPGTAEIITNKPSKVIHLDGSKFHTH
jgi:hypothetical protein